MITLRPKVISVLLTTILFLVITLAVCVPGSDAVTENDLDNIVGLQKKFQLMSNQQVRDALEIGKRIIVESETVPYILTDQQKELLNGLGLTNAQVVSAYECVMEQLNTNEEIDNLQSGTLTALAGFFNAVLDNFDQELKDTLVENGVSVADAVSTALEVAGLTIDSFEEIPQAELEQIFSEDSPIAAETAARYGLNWANVEALRDNLSSEEIGKLEDILITIGNMEEPDTGGGGGGTTTPTTGTIEDAEQAADEAEQTVSDPDATDDQVADSVDIAAESLGAVTVETSEQAEKLADVTARVADVLEQAVARVQDSQAAAKLGETAAKVIDSAAKAVDELAPSSKKTVEDTAAKALDATAKAMEKMDAAGAAGVADKIVQSAASLAKKLDQGAAKKIADKTLKVVEKAVEKAGTDKVSESEIELTDEKASVQADLTRIQEKTRAAVQAAESMAQKLAENGLEVKKKIETKVAIEVPATGKEQVETKLPPGTLESLKESGVDKLEVKTEVASISITPETFGAETAGKDIALSAKKVKTEEIPADVRRNIPENSAVVDLNISAGGAKVSKFAKPVEVSIPYSLQEGENPNEVTVFLLQDDGTIQPVGGKYDPASGKVVFKTKHFNKYFAKVARKSFTDLAQCEWARDSIEIMAGKGIIAGRTAAEFDPGADITRAEFSALVVRMLGLSAGDESLPFKDVPEAAWYRQVVAAAYENNLIYGKAADIFEPNGKITRQEMAVIISRVMTGEGYESGSTGDLVGFNDQSQIAGWAENGCGLASREGIIVGMSDGRFAPGEKATRAQAAVMLYRLLEKL